MREWLGRFGPDQYAIRGMALSLAFAAACAALALTYDNWVRDWLFYVAGFHSGFVLFWLMWEWMQERARRQMRDEMHAIGMDTVRQMRELTNNPYFQFPPDDTEPPRLH